MPTRGVHLGKSKSFLRAVLALLEQERPHTYIDPLATLAYYAAMHAFEACFAEGLGSTKRHYTGHEDRIDAVLMNAETYGSRPGTSLSTLYDFSRSARYCQDKRQPQGRQERRQAHMGQDFATVDEVLRRLDRCISKVRSLLGCSVHDLPLVEWESIKDDVKKRIERLEEDDPPGGALGHSRIPGLLLRRAGEVERTVLLEHTPCGADAGSAAADLAAAACRAFSRGMCAPSRQSADRSRRKPVAVPGATGRFSRCSFCSSY